MALKKSKNNSFHQNIASIAVGVFSFFRSVGLTLLKFIIFLFRLVAKPFVVFAGFSSEVKAAIIGGIFLLLYGILNEAGVISDLAKMIKTRHEIAFLQIEQSGFARNIDESLISLDNRYFIVGDDSQDQQVKLFLTFYIGDIPRNAIITDAKLSFQCSLDGDIAGFGDLSLLLALFNDYSKNVFNQHSPDYYFSPASTRLYFPKNSALYSSCTSGKTLYFSGEGIKEIINTQKQYSQINFVVFFNGNSQLDNKKSDGMKILEHPQLEIWFTP
jgi:hypothetical protein